MKCSDLCAGKIRHLISIEAMQTSTTDAGGRVVEWVKVLDTYAYVKPLSGSERFHAMRTEANISRRIYLRYRADIKPDMRVVYRGLAMQVKAVIDLEERQKWLELWVVEGEAV